MLKIALIFLSSLISLALCAERNSFGEILNKKVSSILDENLNQRIQNALDKIPDEMIPKEFKIDQLAKTDSSHWCCKITPPITSMQQSRVATYNIVNSGKHRCG
jgi:hypothetical protein